MSVSLRRYTVDQVDAFPEDGNRYELLDGILFVTPAPLPAHEALVFRLCLRLGVHLQAWPDVHVAGQSEVVARPRHKLQPDLQVYRADRIPPSWAAVQERWLAVEVASPTTRRYDRAYKLDAYLALGVREVWLVDPATRSVTVGREGSVPMDVTGDLIWTPPPPAPPLRIDLGHLFADLPPA
ncbi:MAG: Uma2 family endonuclease [Gemmatimonadales bacterium]